MKTLTLTAPAKLNLFLHINGRRADGYHELETLFTMLEYGDELTFSLIKQDIVEIGGDVAGIPLQENLIYRAAEALRPYKQSPFGAHVQLVKKLPMGGGVGGGSSDAATTLLALNTLWQCDLSLDQLADIGLSLGADVPVFVRGKTALAQGVGEKLSPYTLATKHYLVVFPNVHVGTVEVFTHPELPRNTPKLSEGWTIDQTHNDCQALVKKLYPEVEKTLSWLLKYAPSRMTGTGGCCFAEFDSAQAAQRVLEQLPSHWTGFVTQSASESIAHRQLAAWRKDEVK
ncbi:4-(cytidine 5'-diphospho)-2-C-methyl-D-erythritol kinase [Pseudoalteromonas rubra]|uniref:4-diphosphocytidyl-2-C-methyl-D-erythritol kinase n=1 Tax=Pseudoalteromonas rubra TaxID=43658 RepID=A0A4V2E3P6_9GAMM|nr:4-(cytidine 5'-diphospho)-2-C-methyl-D-erythritol kinase [Pseudoalteromonas rubra]RZM83170.1 4-(cytidine 5'-diphospho)-2-C-methyl-D-erythritol kinase [Pseudoalteromonas rubra]